MVLVGVTWAILDWLDAGLLPEALNNAEVAGKFVLLETGGMKGRGVEPIRQEVHEAIHRRLPGIQIASEYGMTEMMSQAYALDGIHQKFPPWVLPVVRDARDPMAHRLGERSVGCDGLGQHPQLRIFGHVRPRPAPPRGTANFGSGRPFRSEGMQFVGIRVNS